MDKDTRAYGTCTNRNIRQSLPQIAYKQRLVQETTERYKWGVQRNAEAMVVSQHDGQSPSGLAVVKI